MPATHNPEHWWNVYTYLDAKSSLPSGVLGLSVMNIDFIGLAFLDNGGPVLVDIT